MHKACTEKEEGERRRHGAPSFVAMTQPNGGSRKIVPRISTLSRSQLAIFAPPIFLLLQNDPFPDRDPIPSRETQTEFERRRSLPTPMAHGGARAHNQKACRNRELAPSRGCAAIPCFSINRQQQRRRRRQRRPALLTRGEPQRRGDGGSKLLV